MRLFKDKRKSNHTTLKVVGGAALVALAVGIIVFIPDIKRYARILSM